MFVPGDRWRVTLRVLQFVDLRESKGLRYSRTHIDRLVAADQFPKPFRLGGRGSRCVWSEDEVDQWLADRMKAAKLAALDKPPKAKARAANGAEPTLVTAPAPLRRRVEPRA
jgi:predicted DNA-binding transcriptional regulator AlpA